MTCRLCYYRIHDWQAWAWYDRGDKRVPVHAFHQEEGKITIIRIARNVYDEEVEYRAFAVPA